MERIRSRRSKLVVFEGIFAQLSALDLQFSGTTGRTRDAVTARSRPH
jgi:hypothetical protein